MKYLYLYIPYLFILLAQWFPKKPWFFPANQNTYVVIAIFFLGLQTALLIAKKKKYVNEILNTRYLPQNWLIASMFFLFMLCFPILNRSWGDGLLLLETNLLETKLFGFQFTLDEILESILHSQLTNLLSVFQLSEDPVVSYSILSYTAGVFFLASFLWLGKNKSNNLSIFILLSSGGFLLTFGYAENYTLVTTIHLGLYLFVHRYSQEPKDNDQLLYGSTILVALSMLFHLVSGYLALLLFYLWYFHSPKEKKVKHLILCTVIGSMILLPWFVYLTLLHDPTVDRNSTHLIHPPFYPIKRLISMNHFKEFFSVLYWNVFLSSFYLVYQWLFEKEKWKNFIKQPNHRLMFVATFAFVLHGLIHNPQLGFPADWDLMGFYWLPITFLAFLYWNEENLIHWKWIPVLLFGVTIMIVSAIELNKTNPKDELVWEITKKAIDTYAKENRTLIESLPKEEKKFFAKGDFLFFKGEHITKQLCDFPNKQSLIDTMKQHRKDWKEGFLKGSFRSKETLSAFLTEATKTNVIYLKSLEANTICHPLL